MPETAIAFSEELIRLATSHGATVVDGLPVHVENMGIVVLEPPEFFRALNATPPRLVYLQTSIFDFEEEIASALEAFQEEGALNLRGELQEAVHAEAARNGAVCESTAAFFADGLLHFSQRVADWYEQLQEKVGAKVDVLHAERRGAEDQRSARLDGEIREKAHELACHPGFNFSRPSFEKRLVLARTLWPEQEESILRIVTDEAQKIDWLRQSGAVGDV